MKSNKPSVHEYSCAGEDVVTMRAGLKRVEMKSMSGANRALQDVQTQGASIGA